MAISSRDISISMEWSNDINMVLGREKKIAFKISNLSITDKLYNLSLILLIPNGCVLEDTNYDYTEEVRLQGNGICYNFINLKDFAINEKDFLFEIQLRSVEKFLANRDVAIGDRLQATLTAIIDTMPRGNADLGNIKISSSYYFNLVIQRLALIKTIPEKFLKGAGLEGEEPYWIMDNTISVMNNTRESSEFDLIDTLADGIRLIGNFNSIKINQLILNPTIRNIGQGWRDTLIKWSNIILLPNETLEITYQTAIWDRFSNNGIENKGAIIPHGTKINMNTSVLGVDFTAVNATSVMAMDVIVDLQSDKNVVDVDTELHYQMIVKVNQYHGIKDTIITIFLPDGQRCEDSIGGKLEGYTSGFSLPITYEVDTLSKNSTHNVELNAKIASQYLSDEKAITCGDSFRVVTSVQAINEDTEINDFDSDSCTQDIGLPNITKTILAIFNREQENKIGKPVVPLDQIIYAVEYNSIGIKAKQKDILMDDFIPLSMNLPTDQEDVQFIDSHGLRWILGTVNADTLWSKTLQCTVNPSPIVYNNNLLKLTGTNHEDVSYSNRTQVSSVVGTSNLTLIRNVDGIIINAIRSGQSFTMKVTVTNEQNTKLSCCDAYHFMLKETIPSELFITESSLKITGVGTVSSVIFENQIITVLVEKLGVGQSITLEYQATLPTELPPNYQVTMTGVLSIPYTQRYDEKMENVKYGTSEVVGGITLKTASMIMTKSYDGLIKQVNSIIPYTITVTVPIGTMARQISLIDILPTYQSASLIGYIDNQLVNVKLVNQSVIFPTIPIKDALRNSKTIVFQFSAMVTDILANVASNSIQTNQCNCSYLGFYGQTQSIDTYKNITVSKPKISLVLKSLGDLQLVTGKNVSMQLVATNGSVVIGKNCSMYLPIPEKMNYYSSSVTTGTVVYNRIQNRIEWFIDTILPNQSTTLSVSCKTATSIRAKDQVSFKANSSIYFGELSKIKSYPAVMSNTLTYGCKSGLKFEISKVYRTKTGDGWIQVYANSNVTISYTLTNTGGGIDGYQLSITKTKYPCLVYIDQQLIGSVDENDSGKFVTKELDNIRSMQDVKVAFQYQIPKKLPPLDQNPVTIMVSSLYDTTMQKSIYTKIVDP